MNNRNEIYLPRLNPCLSAVDRRLVGWHALGVHHAILMLTPLLASWLIGSDKSCDIVVTHPMVSGQHCRLYQYERQFTLEDMGSTNGTYVDGIRIISSHACYCVA